MGIGISNCAGKSIRQDHQDQHQNKLSPRLNNRKNSNISTKKSQITGSKTQDNLMSIQQKNYKNRTSNSNARIIINTENIDKKYNNNFKQSNIYKSYSLSVLNRKYLDQLNNSKYLFALGSSNASQAEILANSSASSITGVNNNIDSSSPTNTYRLTYKDTKLPSQKDNRRDLSSEKSIRFSENQKLNLRRDKPNRISLKPSKSDKLEAINFVNSSSSSNSRNLKQNSLAIPVTLPSKSTSPNKTSRDSPQRRFTSLTRANNSSSNTFAKREVKTAYNTRTNTRKLNNSVSPTTSNSRLFTAGINKNNTPRITKSNNNLTSNITRNSNFHNLRREMNHNLNGHYHRPRLSHHTYEYEHKHKHQHHHHHYYHQPIGSPTQLNGINGFSIPRSNGYSQNGGSGLEDIPISPTVSVFSSKNEAEYFKANNGQVFGNLYNQG